MAIGNASAPTRAPAGGTVARHAGRGLGRLAGTRA